MKNHIILKIMSVFAVAAFISACDRELDSEGIALGLVRYPAITLNDGNSASFVADAGEYEEPGAVATLGTDDISDQMVIEGVNDIDASAPGVYPVDYVVSIENEIGQQSTVTQTRYVIVTSEDISDVDLSGDYIGTGFAANPVPVHVTKLANGWYSIDDVLSSTNGIAASFAHLGGNEITIPDQTTGFGQVNTSSGGANATLTPEGFTWEVYISCCGVFGPIEFVRQ